MATRTKQLQRRLLEEDVPRACGHPGVDRQGCCAPGAAQLPLPHGLRPCPRIPHLEFTRADQRLWLALRRWTWETRDGDREGLGPSAGATPLWDKVSAPGPGAARAASFRATETATSRLRAEVAKADLIIVNHALCWPTSCRASPPSAGCYRTRRWRILDGYDLEGQLTETAPRT
ncbi:MAG: hypothetical protein IPN91_14290 [Holophagaceae bacterium]|uniref:Uncharacterized protein n=1 Tax=Candidatus Geothrix odensensis TaxID=2954440 RepID=A0A936F619_9BACT|nr:hypothetical protein [Candidatus Geothrix odensensis]